MPIALFDRRALIPPPGRGYGAEQLSIRDGKPVPYIRDG